MALRGQRLFSALVAAGCVASSGISATAAESSAADRSQEHFADLSLEELLKVSVTTVSRTTGSLQASPAAVTVITQEDLRSAGVQRLPEAFRLVPGMDVAQSSATSWAVSARGFNDTYANKLLLMRDGRSIYTPLFSGVYWNNHNPLIEDIDRIEVVRGPGATVWGANAVNGVVNIVSKSAFDTLGGLVSAGAGTEVEGNVSARYGFKLGDTAAIRLSLRETWTDNSIMSDGSASWDHDRIITGGFRADWKPDDRNTATFIGEVHSESTAAQHQNPSFFPPYAFVSGTTASSDGGFIQGRWQHDFSAETAFSAQLSYDHLRNADQIIERRDTGDIELQLTTSALPRHTFSMGLQLRSSRDDLTPTPFRILSPASKSEDLLSTFVQDEITLVENRLKLTLGSKFEFSDSGGFQPQPGARLAWTPNDKTTLWFSASQAARTPSRAEQDAWALTQVIPPGTTTPPNPLPIAVVFQGRDAIDSEQLVAFETGLRLQASPRLNFDIAGFFNSYGDLLAISPTSMTPKIGPNGAYLENVMSTSNLLEGDTYGFEASTDWRVLENLRLRASYSLLETHIRPTPEGVLAGASRLVNTNPNQQASLGVDWEPVRNWEISSRLRWVDRLEEGNIPSYFGLDLRIAWTPRPGLEFSIVGKDLLEDRHSEFGEDRFALTGMHDVQRSVYGQITWKF